MNYKDSYRNPLFEGGLTSAETYMGLEIVVDDSIPEFEYVPDLSGCRSPSRALRRWRKRDILGRIVIKTIPSNHSYLVGRRLFVNQRTRQALLAMREQASNTLWRP